MVRAKPSRPASKGLVPNGTASEKRGGQQESAYALLKEMIILQDLPAGTLVSELSLSKQLGLGRSPIRWAFQRLATEGLVSILPQRGVMVTDINVDQQLKLLEVRAELERLMVVGAARRATQAQRQRMRSLAKSFEALARSGDGKAFMAMLKEIHDLTAEAADNEILDNVIGQVQGLSRRFWYTHYERHGDLKLAAKLHAERLRRIAAGDAPGAAAASDALVDYLERFTRSTLAYGAGALSAAGP